MIHSFLTHKINILSILSMFILFGCGKENTQSNPSSECSQRFVNSFRDVERTAFSFMQKQNDCYKDKCDIEEVKKEASNLIRGYENLKAVYPKIESCEYKNQTLEISSLTQKVNDAKDFLCKIEICKI